MITYIKGDATAPIGEGTKLLCHICNDKFGWGLGFVLSLSKKWKAPEYRYRNSLVLEMGTIQVIDVEDDIIVINMIAQTLLHHAIPKSISINNKFEERKIPLSYPALEECLKKVNKIATKINATVHGPRFGAGLAGGDWKVIEQMINDIISVPVFIYDLE